MTTGSIAWVAKRPRLNLLVCCSEAFIWEIRVTATCIGVPGIWEAAAVNREAAASISSSASPKSRINSFWPTTSYSSPLHSTTRSPSSTCAIFE